MDKGWLSHMKGFSTMQVFLYIFQIGKVRLPYKMAAFWEGGEFKCRFHTGKVNLPSKFIQEGRLGEFKCRFLTGKVN